MIASILKWLFVQYNRGSLKSEYFEGELCVKGLQHSVTIFRDENSVPHIYAQTNADLMYAQGWVHAQDRLWQMEMNRRVAMGRVAEAFGDIALDTDRLTRTLGFNRLAEEDWQNTSSQLKSLLESYADGVNAYIENGKLPIEFKLTGVNPEPWLPVHSLGWVRIMAWTLSHGWSGALTRQEIINKIGPEKAAELAIYYPDENPVEMPNGLEMLDLSTDEMIEAMAGPFLAKDMEGGGRGSNAWVVSPKRSATGRPILCNDTHLVLSTPGVWYINHLHSEEGIHIFGVSLPGVGGCLIGHNEYIAWGITLAFTDVEDIFVEKVSDSDPTKYVYRDEDMEFKIIEEKIAVKGEDEHIEKVHYTVHGPLINDVTRGGDHAISLCSKSLEPIHIADALFNLNTAKNISDFSAAIEMINAPQLNMAYGDVEGNIALLVTGRVPVRKRGNGQLPLTGWTGEFDWDGEIPLEKMPKIINPQSGYLISCNNKIIADDYPHFLGNSFMNGYRSIRIEDIFKLNNKISIDLCKKLHTDFFSIPGKIFIEGMVKGLRTARPKVQKMLDVLIEWDYQLNKDSPAATIYQVLIYTMLRNLVEPQLGKSLTDRYMGVGEHPLLLPTSELLGHTTPALFRMLQNPESQWIDSSKDVLKLIEISIMDTCKWLEENMGYEPDDWHWGEIHQARFRHGMSVKEPLDAVFDVGPYPIGGDTDTVCQTAFNPGSPYHATEWCPSIRLIMDVGAWDNSVMISPPGQSGVLGSPHYSDMAEKWIDGEYIPMLWSRDKVESSAKKKIMLKPE